MRDYGDGKLARTFAFIACLFLAAPLIAVIGSSFTSGSYITFPPDGFSFAPYEDIANHPGFDTSTWLSLLIALIVSVVTTLIALVTARGLSIRRRAGKRTGLLDLLFLAPIMIPHAVLGVAMLQLLQGAGIPISPWPLVLAHVVITIPFGIRIITTTNEGLDLNTERAAEILGASGLELYLKVILPQLRPAVVATFFLSATLSLGEVGASLFLADAKTVTLPVRLFQFMQYQALPFISAIGALLIAVPLVIALLTERPFGLARLFGIKAGRR